MGRQDPRRSAQPSDGMPHLTAEGPTPVNEGNDCVVYLFVCLQHSQVAVCNLLKIRVVSLPFVALARDETIELGSKCGLELFLGVNDEERFDGDGKPLQSCSKMPNYKMDLVHLLRIQLMSEVFELRYTQLVRLSPTEG